MSEPEDEPVGEGTTTLDMWKHRAEAAEKKLADLLDLLSHFSQDERVPVAFIDNVLAGKWERT